MMTTDKKLPRLYGSEKAHKIEEIREWVEESGHPPTFLEMVLDRYLTEEQISQLHRDMFENQDLGKFDFRR